MINYVNIQTQTNGPVLLTFSNWAVSRFCTLMGIKSNKSEILTHLIYGEDNLKVAIALLQAGAEATAKQKGIPMVYSEFDISEWAVCMSNQADADRIIYAFFGSMWGVQPDEVPALLEEIVQKANEALRTGGSPNAKTPPTRFSTGSSSSGGGINLG